MIKYFISCAVPGRQLGAIQIEAKDQEESQTKAEALCPERAMFRSYVIEEFDKDMPIDEFVPTAKMKELGY